jgi:hypothetical protein
MERSCMVFIPHPVAGNCMYQVAARSSFEAARGAIAEHEKHYPRLADDVVVQVVVDGKSFAAWIMLESTTPGNRTTGIAWAFCVSRFRSCIESSPRHSDALGAPACAL